MARSIDVPIFVTLRHQVFFLEFFEKKSLWAGLFSPEQGYLHNPMSVHPVMVFTTKRLLVSKSRLAMQEKQAHCATISCQLEEHLGIH